MKRLYFPNGDIHTAYEFKDLTGHEREYAIGEEEEFLYKMNNYDIDDVYEFNEEEIIASIEINEYLFNEDGEILPVTTHVRGINNEVWKHTYGRNSVEIEIKDID